MKYSRFQKLQKYYLGEPVSPPEYKRGSFITTDEWESIEDCESDKPEYIWNIVSNEYICVETDRTGIFEKYEKLQAYDKDTAEPAEPPQYKEGSFIGIGQWDNTEYCEGGKASLLASIVGTANSNRNVYLSINGGHNNLQLNVMSNNSFEQNISDNYLVSCKNMFSSNEIYTLEILLDTHLVRDFSSMFYQSILGKLRKLEIYWMDVSQATNMNLMFSGCKNFTELDLLFLNTSTSKLTTCESMFSGCSNLKKLDLSNLNVSGLKTWRNMFSGCKNLIELDLSGWNLLDLIDNQIPFESKVYGVFDECNSLTTIYVRNCDTDTLDVIKYALEDSNIIDQVSLISN